jgi:hypothetical protein
MLPQDEHRREWLDDDVRRARQALDSLERAPFEHRWCGDERAYRVELDRRLAALRAAERARDQFKAEEEAAAELAETYRDEEAA